MKAARTLIRLALLLIAGGFVFGSAPIALAACADVAGAVLGCEVHEGFANPCPLWGRDIGSVLYQFTVLGWLALVTVPVGLAVIAAGLVVLVVGLVSRHGQSRNGGAGGARSNA